MFLWYHKTMKVGSGLKTFLSASILIGYMFLSIFAVLHLAHMRTNGMGMHPCPYMTGEQAVCTMTFSEHINEWQQYTNIIVPLLSVIFIATIVLFYWKLSLYANQYFLRTNKRFSFFEPLYQSLFSQGILNPKLY